MQVLQRPQKQAASTGLRSRPSNGAMAPPRQYLPLNPAYPGLTAVHTDPPVFTVANFLSEAECDDLINSRAGPHDARARRWCWERRGKCLKNILNVLPRERRFTNNLHEGLCADGLPGRTPGAAASRQIPRRRVLQGPLRRLRHLIPGREKICAERRAKSRHVLVYFNDVARGGCTSFSKLGLSIQPKKGTALVFFPASLDGMLDQHYLHAAEPALDLKWVSQIEDPAEGVRNGACVRAHRAHLRHRCPARGGGLLLAWGIRG